MTTLKIYFIHKHVEITEEVWNSCDFFNKNI